jgi:non-ribosomal peptide synthetase component E (peptide arylation enzyme)
MLHDYTFKKIFRRLKMTGVAEFKLPNKVNVVVILSLRKILYETSKDICAVKDFSPAQNDRSR